MVYSEAVTNGYSYTSENTENCIALDSFNFGNASAEYVTFQNKCGQDISLSGWSLSDSAGHTYTIIDFTAKKDSYFTIHTGPGPDSKTSLYWNSGSPVWNNEGDVITLKDDSGKIVVQYRYP